MFFVTALFWCICHVADPSMSTIVAGMFVLSLMATNEYATTIIQNVANENRQRGHSA